MEAAIDVKEIGRKAYRTIQDDGLDQFILGVSVALIAIWLFDHWHGWAFVFGIGIQAWLKEPCRKRFTYPRVGYARFPSPQGRTKMLISAIGVTLVLLLGVLMAVTWLSWLLPIYMSAVFAGIIFIIARKYGSILDYIYALLFLISGITCSLFVSFGYDPGKVTGVQFWCLAAVLMPIGLVKLVLFLRRYPKVAEEVSDGKD